MKDMITTKKKRLNLLFAILSLFALFLSPIASVAATPSKLIQKWNTTEKVVAFTFDDGSDGTNIQSILTILSTHDINATFFLTGSAAKNHSQKIRNITQQGHEIGVHTYSHPYFMKITAAETKSQLQRTEETIRGLTGQTTKPLFRPPYGDYNSTVLQSLVIPGQPMDGSGGSTPPTVTTKYTVKSGDTLYSIAKRYRVSVQQIAQASNIQNINLIRPGQQLTIPGKSGTSTPGPSKKIYTIKAGDTSYAIAKRYGVSVVELAKVNKLSNPNLIRIGQTLTIP